MEHHFHMGRESVVWVGMAAMLFRYVWKLLSGYLASSDGVLGQLGLAMGGIAQ